MTGSRILLADDHSLILEGFRSLLEPTYEVVAMVTDGKALVEAALRFEPELIILDITMPLTNGIEAAREIRKRLPQTKLLFVTMHTSPTYLQAAMGAGANGYALKSSGRNEILAAVEKVLSGDRYITPDVSREGVEVEPPRGLPAALSPREQQVLRLTADGKSRKEVAYILRISEKTVAFHKNNLMRKLSLRNTAQLIKYALDEGMI